MKQVMISRRGLGGLMTFGLGTALLSTMATKAIAAPNSGEIDLVRSANIVLDKAERDPEFGNSRELFQSAKAVMVVPQLVKGGFFVGGEGGNGVLMARHGGKWSYPAFYTLASASFGLQIGLEVAQVVLFVMSDAALNAWMTNKVKLGGDAGLTVLVLGTDASAAATTHLNADVIAWAKAKGAYAGISLQGSVIVPHTDWNTAYYGRPITPGQILQKKA
jgi:lipid-binding SYLF domain-containing protein